jgi:hypothetical protein
MDTAYIPLAQAIGELRTELAAAIENAVDERLRFRVDAIEVELQLVATTTGKGEVGAGLWQVLTAKAAIEHARAATHKVKLVLNVRTDSPNGEALIGDSLPAEEEG